MHTKRTPNVRNYSIVTIYNGDNTFRGLTIVSMNIDKGNHSYLKSIREPDRNPNHPTDGILTIDGLPNTTRRTDRVSGWLQLHIENKLVYNGMKEATLERYTAGKRK
jgi:hypothetical protein